MMSPSAKLHGHCCFSYFSSGLNVRSFKLLTILKDTVLSIKSDHVEWPL